MFRKFEVSKLVLGIMMLLSLVFNEKTLFPVDANTNTFTVLTYNVAGLPDLFTSEKPAVNNIKISPLLNTYDLIAVQEDFTYHNDLIKHTTHSYLTSHSGNVPFGDGMNFISNFLLKDTKRITWKKRYGFLGDGNDQLTPKGFMYTQMIVEPGVYIDVYTLHTDAGGDSGSLAARKDNIVQLAEYINTHSLGNAVIVLGDTNSRYTREDDNFETKLLEACDLQDPWIDLIRDGIAPSDGDALMDDSDKNGPNYEVVDKIFYRSSPSLELTALSYRLEDTIFVDEKGEQLSDHYPITVTFQYTKNPNIKMSNYWGGSGGTAFNFLSNDTVIHTKPTALTIYAGARLDGISVTYEDGTVLSQGGKGGSAQTLVLENNEYLTEVIFYKNKYNGDDRIFYGEFKTNIGRVISGGTKTGESFTFSAPSGYYIAGFFGRSGTNIDQIGMISKPLTP